MFWRKCLCVGIVGVLLYPHLSLADWAFNRPGAGEEWKKNQTVNSKGTGEDGVASDLYVGVHQGGLLVNAGTGTWSGQQGAHWLVDVSVPGGGWTVGEAVRKVFIEGEQTTGQPKATETFSFVN